MFFLGLILLSVVTLSAQERTCGTMDHLEHQLEGNPNLRYIMQNIERQTQETIKGAGHRMGRDVVIPVVVHVVYNSPDQNISQAQIQSQIQVLNEDFRFQNPDRDQVPHQWASLAADTRISFQLANRDPQGQTTTGITRTRTNTEAFMVQNNFVKFSSMGGVDAWPTDQYLNIWVCNLAMGVLGYSQFPGGPSATDGVVIGYRFFGNVGNVKAPFNGGRTCTHEVGHWLNLRHIWGDGPCSVDDLVADTPPADRPSQGCPTFRSACNGPIMTSNYMDYTDDACMNMFTFGQAERMQALFLPGGARVSLRNSPGLVQQATPAPMVKVVAEPLTPTSVKLSWVAVPDAEAYNVRFRRMGTEEWQRNRFDDPVISTVGLQPCTDYECQVEPVVAGRGLGYSPPQAFRTNGCPTGAGSVPVGTSLSPTRLQATVSGLGEARLYWEAVSGASGYRLQYKVAGSRVIKSMYLESNSTQVQHLESGKKYFWRVRADFQGQSGPFSPVAIFSYSPELASLRVTESVMEAPMQHPIRKGDLPVKLNLSEPGAFAGKIVNASGAIVKRYSARSLPSQEWFKFPVAGLPPGRYQIVLVDADGFELVHEVQLD